MPCIAEAALQPPDCFSATRYSSHFCYTADHPLGVSIVDRGEQPLGKHRSLPDLENWPTSATDKAIAVEIIKRHCAIFGRIKVLEYVTPLTEEDGGTFEVGFPPWLIEMQNRFLSLYGEEEGWRVFEKALLWVRREFFNGYVAIALE